MPQETVSEDAKFEKSIELGFNKLRHARASVRPDLGQEDLEVFLDRLMQGSLFLAPPPIVNRFCSRCMHGAHGP